MNMHEHSPFLRASMDDWRKIAERALNGGNLNDLLSSHTPEGITLDPLYECAADARPITRHQQGAPWTVVQKMDHTNAQAANRQAHEDLMNGATGLAMVFADAHTAHGFGLDAVSQTFDIALENIDLHAITLHIEPGPRGKKTQELFADYIRRAGYNPKELSVRFGLDAIGAVAACGTMRWPFAEIQDHMRDQWQQRLDEGFAGPFFEADGRIFHDAGADNAQELAIILANALALFRTLDAARGDTRQAADAIGFTLSVDSDQLIQIAKCRALRLLWNRVQQASGLTPKPALLHAETSFRMLAAQDPHTNLLRLASGAFAAAIGGADSLTVTPFTAAIGLPDSFARRMARNLQTIFLEESNLYRVADPACGSGALESLTHQLCHKAWALFQDIEARGGVDQALTSGLIHQWIKNANEIRRDAICEGKKTILGVSFHPHNGDQERHVLAVERRRELLITKGALTVEPLKCSRDEILAESIL